MGLNEMFKAWRLKANFTQKDVSELIGISKSAYQRFEQLNAAGFKTFNKIQEFYRQNRSEFGGEDIGS